MDTILDVKMQDNDANAETIGDYLVALLATLWKEGEGFSGKRPFGNSGWEYELYIVLVKNDIVSGSFDEYDDLEDVDTEKADRIIQEAIKCLYQNHIKEDTRLEEALDKIDALEAKLSNAVATAYDRGAIEWTKLNFPVLYERMTKPN
jgi:hypothetical protein